MGRLVDEGKFRKKKKKKKIINNNQLQKIK